ncbi:MAG: hypothetical protein ACE5HP_11290 [Gemmatimonadota bacterium]
MGVRLPYDVILGFPATTARALATSGGAMIVTDLALLASLL